MRCTSCESESEDERVGPSVAGINIISLSVCFLFLDGGKRRTISSIIIIVVSVIRSVSVAVVVVWRSWLSDGALLGAADQHRPHRSSRCRCCHQCRALAVRYHRHSPTPHDGAPRPRVCASELVVTTTCAPRGVDPSTAAADSPGTRGKAYGCAGCYVDPGSLRVREELLHSAVW